MKITIVLTGYYYKYLELYEKIAEEIKLNPNIEFELFISSHKKELEIDESVLALLEEENWRIKYFDNEGWDWGCHSQFVNWYFHSQIYLPNFFLFLHDDIRIVKNGFIKEFLKKVEEGFQVIGNSYPFSVITDYSVDFPEEDYLLKKNGFSTPVKEIKPVRGSAFFIDSRLVDRTLKQLPFQRKGPIDLANRSLRMFAAIVANEFSMAKTGYLSQSHLKSDFIVEEMRGTEQTNLFSMKRKILNGRKKIKSLLKDLLISLTIINREKTKNSRGKIKLNISNGTHLSGFLNYDMSNPIFSDITDLDSELDILFRNAKISEIRIAENTGANGQELLIKLLKKKYASYDILLEGNNYAQPLMEMLKNNPNIKMYNDYSMHFDQLLPNKRTLLKINDKNDAYHPV